MNDRYGRLKLGGLGSSQFVSIWMDYFSFSQTLKGRDINDKEPIHCREKGWVKGSGRYYRMTH